jgi:hypothetical protein
VNAAVFGDVPPAVTTVIHAGPTVPAGEVAVQLVVVQLGPVPAIPPKSIVVAPATKPVPVTVTEVPPATGPAFTLMAVTVGTAS